MKEMEDSTSTIWNGRITGIKFALATVQEICKASISDCPIIHASQLSNPFLGLPLDNGKCESCGAGEIGQCEGHFGYIELPIPIYHPSHLGELRRLLSAICLKCLKVKNKKVQQKNIGIFERAFSACCEEASLITIDEQKTTDGAGQLELKVKRYREGFWNFLDRYGYRYGERRSRPLLPSEVQIILKKLPADTKKKLSAKGFFPQDGYIMQHLSVPPNCLSVPDVSDGITVMSSDLSITMLKKILRKIEIIKTSRSGTPNFEAHEVESNDLQVVIAQYLDVRGTSKASRAVQPGFGNKKGSNDSTKAWLEKMKTLFISKGSGFSSRSVITGDAYKGVNEVGLPSEIAQKITFEEKVTEHNMQYLQKLVDEKLCLTYKDGQSTFSLKEGSMGHTFLRPGQVVHRRVMDGDTVFINRPPTTHKHSLQALSVYIHDEHIVKINPLICGPLSADFDGDCVHLFYPQSLAAKAEVEELFSVEKQLLCSHNSKLNLQVGMDSLLSLKTLFRNCFLSKASAQQLAMFLQNLLPGPALLKPRTLGDLWTASQILQTAFPQSFDCSGDTYTIQGSQILKLEFSRDMIQSTINEILAAIFKEKGPDQVLRFLNSLQPMLMENLFSEGFSVNLGDFYVPKEVLETIQNGIQDISTLLKQVRSTYNELVELQIDAHLRLMRVPIADFIVRLSEIGNIMDSKSDAAISKVVQQIGFLGIQLTDKGKFYTKTLVEDMASLFRNNYPSRSIYKSEEFGLVRSCLFHGLDPFQEMVHSISAREVIIRSSRGLTEPGTLFKNLMAILRDVNICYDGTVRNVCSNSVIQFQYGAKPGNQSLFAAGEPVGVLAATAMSNPAYKAVLDSSSSSNSSWEMMKETLLCPVTFKNNLVDRKVTLYLNDCECGRKYCRENAAYAVKNHLKQVSLKDLADEFLIEYHGHQLPHEGSQGDGNLLGHVHLNKLMFQNLHVSNLEICEKVQGRIDLFLKQKGMKKKDIGLLLKRLKLSSSEYCSFGNTCGTDMPCLTFFWQDLNVIHLDETSQALTDMILPVIMETIVKGDPRVSTANIIWIAPDTTTWIRNSPTNQNGELALEIVLEKDVVKRSGDAWRVVMDSCLPVIHLIDTNRSTPNAIKQVQELLGISAAFNQAVQRLSTSVSMVTKGIVKEHLVLLANSMTYSGNMIGFNSGGIKALSRSSNVQVPFAEATLFTPKKCFERAAEKGHVDSLSSIVASCSWGKQVSVGTGSRFDILWDTKEVGKDQQEAIDVYDFLHLVRSSSKADAVKSACLGADIDDLDVNYDDGEMAMSPEPGAGKPTFEDTFEFQNGTEDRVRDLGNFNDSWGKKSSAISENGKDWATGNKGNWGSTATTSAKSNAWSSWGTDSAQKESTIETPLADQSKGPAANSWGSSQKDEPTGSKPWGTSGSTQASWDAKAPSPKPNVQSSWGDTEKPIENDSAADSWGSGKRSKPTSAKECGSAEKQTCWGSGATSTKLDIQSPWGSVSAPKEDAIGKSWPGKEKQSTTDSWGSAKGDDSTGGKKQNSWGSGVPSPRTNVQFSWGPQKEDTFGKPWAVKEKEPASDSWGSKGSTPADGKKWGDSDTQTSWKSGAPSSKPDAQSSWGAVSAPKEDAVGKPWAIKEKEPAADSWGSAKATEPTGGKDWGSSQSPKPSVQSSWGAVSAQKEDTIGHSWAGKEKEPASDSWGSKKSESSGGTEWGGSSDTQTSWGSGEPSPKPNSWGSAKRSEPAGGKTWGSGAPSPRPNQRDDNTPGTPSSQWGPPKRFNNPRREQNDSPRGWGSSGAGEWKQKASGLVTATRQRLDMFTTEEQEILQVIEPIMLSIRRIMHQSGYNDGDKFSADDQTYILDNVFNYHPEKTAKMGVGIDYVMVNKHSSFQDSRCLYVVLTDGHQEDFSYRKCLENFVKIKFAELAEDFNGKYFVKPRPRINRDQSVGPEEAAAKLGVGSEEAAGILGAMQEEAAGKQAEGSEEAAGTEKAGDC